MPERRIQYDKLAHTADTGFLVRAPSIQRLFIDAALALTDHLVPHDLIRDEDRRKVTVKSDTRDRLMVEWLNATLRLFREEHFLAKRIVFESFDGQSIAATLTGETYHPTRHGSAPEMTQVSPRQFQIGEASHPEGPFFVRVFFE